MGVEFSFNVCECYRNFSEKNEDKKEVNKIDKETEFITKVQHYKETELLKTFSSMSHKKALHLNVNVWWQLWNEWR